MEIERLLNDAMALPNINNITATRYVIMTTYAIIKSSFYWKLFVVDISSLKMSLPASFVGSFLKEPEIWSVVLAGNLEPSSASFSGCSNKSGSWSTDLNWRWKSRTDCTYHAWLENGTILGGELVWELLLQFLGFRWCWPFLEARPKNLALAWVWALTCWPLLEVGPKNLLSLAWPWALYWCGCLEAGPKNLLAFVLICAAVLLICTAVLDFKYSFRFEAGPRNLVFFLLVNFAMGSTLSPHGFHVSLLLLLLWVTSLAQCQSPFTPFWYLILEGNLFLYKFPNLYYKGQSYTVGNWNPDMSAF